MGKACCHRMHKFIHEKKRREFLLLSKRSCCQASTVDFSCWSKELDTKCVLLDMQCSLHLWREERRSSVPRICSNAICLHWESCHVESSRRPVEIYWRSQAPKRRKIDAEPSSSHRIDKKDSESYIGNGTSECSIMTDLSGKDILKLQDELQLLQSENRRLKNSSVRLTKQVFRKTMLRLNSTLVFLHLQYWWMSLHVFLPMW